MADKEKEITITLCDEEHLDAHTRDFYITLDEAFDSVRKDLESRDFKEGFIKIWFTMDKTVGLTGVKIIDSPQLNDFWGYRRNRQILSHLIVAEKEETCDLCYMGYWDKPKDFRLLTCYPGRTAPREIHDLSQSPAEMKEAVVFWSSHAIIVSEGDYAL